jgi:hypothetical protein
VWRHDLPSNRCITCCTASTPFAQQKCQQTALLCSRTVNRLSDHTDARGSTGRSGRPPHQAANGHQCQSRAGIAVRQHSTNQNRSTGSQWGQMWPCQKWARAPRASCSMGLTQSRVNCKGHEGFGVGLAGEGGNQVEFQHSLLSPLTMSKMLVCLEPSSARKAPEKTLLLSPDFRK